MHGLEEPGAGQVRQPLRVGGLVKERLRASANCSLRARSWSAKSDSENQIRGLAVVFGVRLPRALTAVFIDDALKASEGIAGLSAAMRGLIAARTGPSADKRRCLGSDG
jgi:hypothetical protein